MGYTITQKFISGLPQTGYRNGVGAYEGVVAHSTASANSTAAANANYESSHWNDAFVHFFVDWTSIIQVADTKYKAWGAGATANARYVHVELCEPSDPNQFKEAYARYIWLLAKILHDRKLGVTRKSTFWTHHDVTTVLGGTTHTDPDNYLSAHGVSIDQLVSDVTNQYKAMDAPTPAPAPTPTPTPSTVYRVRKTWGDAQGQIGAFANLDSAKALADQHKAEGYKVFDPNGNIAYDPAPAPAPAPTHLYRVRKAWGDATSQIGAYSNLDSAKTLASQNAGYKVFDENGTVVFDPTPAPAPSPTPVPMYRVRKSWEDASSQLGAFSELGNAKALVDIKPGYYVFDEDGKRVYPTEEIIQANPTPVVDVHAGHHSIKGTSVSNAEQMSAFVKAVNPAFDDAIPSAFLKVGEKYGIRGDVAFCQSIIETGYFKFDGGTAVTPDQHNYAGIGVTSKGMKGNSFSTIEQGVTAQMQHLLAYATTDPIPNGEIVLDPRFNLVTRGIAPHWEDLDNHWAMNSQYGESILALFNKLIVAPVPKPTPIVEQPAPTPVEETPVPVEVIPEPTPIVTPAPTPVEETPNPDEKVNVGLINRVLQAILDFLKGLFAKKN